MSTSKSFVEGVNVYENGSSNGLRAWRFPIGNQVLARASRALLKMDTAPLIHRCNLGEQRLSGSLKVSLY